ncbi:hypothetical protein C8J56DRAFT_1054460 [Mycena floridula]|nr:hypothetical protein C8J56DRAFT_1054460 [Mycena floridula]
MSKAPHPGQSNRNSNSTAGNHSSRSSGQPFPSRAVASREPSTAREASLSEGSSGRRSVQGRADIPVTSGQRQTSTKPQPSIDFEAEFPMTPAFISALDQIPSLSSSSKSTTVHVPNTASIPNLPNTAINPNPQQTPKPKLGGPHSLRAHIRTPTRAGVNPDLTKHLQAGRNRLATSQTDLLPPLTGSDCSPRKTKTTAPPNVEFSLPPGLSYAHFSESQLAAFKAFPPDQKLAFYNALFPDSSAATRSNITAPPRLHQTAAVSPESAANSVKAGSSAAFSPSEATKLFFTASKPPYQPKSFPEIPPISIDISSLGPRLRETYRHLDHSASSQHSDGVEEGGIQEDIPGDDDQRASQKGFGGDDGQEDEFRDDDGKVKNRDGPDHYRDEEDAHDENSSHEEESASQRWSHSSRTAHFSNFHPEESVSSQWQNISPPTSKCWKPIAPFLGTTKDLGADFGHEFGHQWRVPDDSNQQGSSSRSSRLADPKNAESSASHQNPNQRNRECSSSTSSLFDDRQNEGFSAYDLNPNDSSREHSSPTSSLIDAPQNEHSFAFGQNPNNSPERASSTSSRLARHHNYFSSGSPGTFIPESTSLSPLLPSRPQSVARDSRRPLPSPSGPGASFEAWDPDMSNNPTSEALISAAYQAMDATIEKLAQLTDKTSVSLIQGYKRHQSQRQGNTWNGFQKMMEDEKEFSEAMELLVGTEHEFTGSVVGEATGPQIRAAYIIFKEKNPRQFKDHIDTWVQASKINVVVTRQQRQRNFDKHFKSMTDIAQGSHVTDAYETVLISGGRMINSDAGLADLYVSPGAQNFLERISKMPINKVMAVFKTHVFNNVADAIITAAHSTDTAAVVEAVQVNPGEADKALTTQVRLGLIDRAALVHLILSKNNFPWKLLLQYIAERGYALRNYPPLAKPPHLGDGKGLGGTSKVTRQQIANKLNDKDAPLAFVEVPITDLKSDKVPVLRYANDPADRRSVYYSHLAQPTEEPKTKNPTKATKGTTSFDASVPMAIRFVPEMVDSSGPSQARRSTTSASPVSKPKQKNGGTATRKKPGVQAQVALSDIIEENEEESDHDYLAPSKPTGKRKRGAGKLDPTVSKKQNQGRGPGPSAAVGRTRETGNRPLTRSRSISTTCQSLPPIAGSTSGLYLPDQDQHRRQIDEALNIAKGSGSASSGPDVGGAEYGPNFNWSYA